MDKKLAIKKAGSAAKLARLLDVTQGAISQWGDLVPRLRVYELRDKRPEWFKATKPRKRKTKLKTQTESA